VADKLENGRGGIYAHTIHTEIAVLAMAAKADLDECVRLTPEGAVHSHPTLAVFALMLDPQITWFDSFGHY